MTNVINININKVVPGDLMRLKDAASKYGIKYCTLYKYTRLLREIPFYNKGGLKVSEQDVKDWLQTGWVPARG